MMLYNANEVKVVDNRPIPAPSDAQLERLTQLRIHRTHRTRALRAMRHEALAIMRAAGSIMGVYATTEYAPPIQILVSMENRTMVLLNDMYRLHGGDIIANWSA
ncbi:hypothetical protein N7463_009796, partial [Penicillium fimorum]